MTTKPHRPESFFEEILNYQDNDPASAPAPGNTPQPNPSTDLLDPEDFGSGSDSSTASANPSWAKNPFAKMGLVGGATAAGFLVLGMIITNVTGGGRITDRGILADTASTAMPEEEFEEEAPSLDGRLKTELALSRQADQLSALQGARPAQRQEPELAIDLEPEAEIAQVEPLPELPPVPVAPPPEPVVEQPRVNDPQEWEKLAQIGSFGAMGELPETARQSPNFGQQLPGQNLYVQQSFRPVSPIAMNTGSQTTLAQAGGRDEMQVLTGVANRSIAIGTTAKATLENPLVWESDFQQPDTFTVRLTEPLLAADNSTPIPSGSIILAQVPRISANGLVQMNGVAAVVERDGRMVEVPLPAGAIQIRGDSGSALLARGLLDVGPDIGSMDAGLFFLSGLGRAAGLFNRPEQDVTISDGVAVVSTRNPQPNIVSGFVEGGTQAIVPDISDRNRQAVDEKLRSGNILDHRCGDLCPSVCKPGDSAVKYLLPVILAASLWPISRPVIAQQQVQGVFASRVQSNGPLLTVHVHEGFGFNINFIPTGETVQRAWLDDPSRVTLDFDAPIDSGGATVIHLRRIEQLTFENLPQTPSTLLTVVTENMTGNRSLYQFRIAYGEPDTELPDYVTLAIYPDSRGMPLIPVATGLQATLEDVENGMRLAETRALMSRTEPLWSRMQDFLSLVRTGESLLEASQRAGVSMALVNKLARDGLEQRLGQQLGMQQPTHATEAITPLLTTSDSE